MKLHLALVSAALIAPTLVLSDNCTQEDVQTSLDNFRILVGSLHAAITGPDDIYDFNRPVANAFDNIITGLNDSLTCDPAAVNNQVFYCSTYGSVSKHWPATVPLKKDLVITAYRRQQIINSDLLPATDDLLNDPFRYHNIEDARIAANVHDGTQRLTDALTGYTERLKMLVPGCANTTVQAAYDSEKAKLDEVLSVYPPRPSNAQNPGAPRGEPHIYQHMSREWIDQSGE